LVATRWLTEHLGEPGLVVVDASWYLPAQNRSATGEYQAGHIPGALFWNLDDLSDRASTLPHMLPDPASLARSIGMLGIGNQDRVVVYDGSGANLSAARVWWTFRVLGHDDVSVLDGGLGRWRANGGRLDAGWPPWAPRRFIATPRPALVCSMEQLRASLGPDGPALIDARSQGRFLGTEPEPRPGLRSGHIPGALSLPYAELVTPEGILLPPDELRRRFEAAGLDLSRPVVTSCGSGVSACALALGLEVLGHRHWSVYDGSWSEWGRPEGPPVETGSP
ncbi:MAG TPA: rhodanese-like domain-containing protein, partial [Gemmatimonadales bacterium]